MGRGGRTVATAHRPRTSAADPASGTGARVRALRVAAGLTQAELGGERFSKEYVSQVELGKSPASDAALDWFGIRLGVDRTQLEGDAGPAAVAAAEAALVRAEAAIEAAPPRRCAGRRSSRCARRSRAPATAAGSSCATRSRTAGRCTIWGGSPRRRRRSTAPVSLAEAGSDHDRALALYRLGRRAVQDGQPRHGRGGARRGAALRDARGRAVRRAAGAHPEHARQDPPPPEGLHRGGRGRDGGARARARARRRPGAGRDVPRRVARGRAPATSTRRRATMPSARRRSSSGSPITSTSASS